MDADPDGPGDEGQRRPEEQRQAQLLEPEQEEGDEGHQPGDGQPGAGTQQDISV
jgi:hypothetical protein